MADQATLKMNGPGVSRGTAPEAGSGQSSASNGNGNGTGVVTSIAELGENLLSLSELQARLAAAEMKQNLEAAKVSAPVLLAGAVLGVASVPLVLAGIAELLVSEMGMKRGYAFLGVAVVSLVVAGICVVIGNKALTRSLVGFPLSSEELTRNLNWVRTIILHSGRSAKAGRR